MPDVCGGKTILEQLASINWNDLSPAYGSAEDVPHLLRDLTSPDEQLRNRALGTLYTTIYHQGTVYQASAYAVPFLLELLREETVPEREELLILLAHLAQGNTYHRQHWHFYSEERKQDPALLAQLEEGIFWVEQTYEAVSAGLPLYFSFLEDPVPKLRMAALRVLGSFSREASQIVSLLVERFSAEGDQRVQACLLLTLGALLARQEEASPAAGSYFAVLADDAKPQWPMTNQPSISLIADAEMARINIETSAALEQWFDILRSDRERYFALVQAAKQLPLPLKRISVPPRKRERLLEWAFFAECMRSLAPPQEREQLVASRGEAEWVKQIRRNVIASPTRILAIGLIDEQSVDSWAERVFPFALFPRRFQVPHNWSLDQKTCEVKLDGAEPF